MAIVAPYAESSTDAIPARAESSRVYVDAAALPATPSALVLSCRESPEATRVSMDPDDKILFSLLDSPRARSLSLALSTSAVSLDDASTIPYSYVPAPIDAMPNDIARIVTPFNADAWETALLKAGIMKDYESIPAGLRNGFDVGLDRNDTFARFSDKNRYTIYDNHSPTARHPEVIEKMIEEESAEGRISAFYDPEDLFRLVGCFRTAPLTIAPKDGSHAKGRVCQDFSHPRDDPRDASFNQSIDMADFSCDWGTFAQCYLLAARAPPGTEVAVFDVKAAHRRVPVMPWQQCFYAMMWKGKAALNFCAQFGAASSSGLFGRLADAFRALFIFRYPSADALNWADDFIFWRYVLGDDFTEEDIYAFAEQLGWPWSPKKTKPFSSRFNYLGFTWDLVERTVEVTQEKKDKYSRALHGWAPGSKITQNEAQSLLGKLVHCCLVIRDGRSRIPRLSRFTAAFDKAPPFKAFRMPVSVAEDLAWWRAQLAQPFCGMPVREIPEPVDIRLYVDASTGWGIGLCVGDHWDHWRLQQGWKCDGRDIGWAEMVAIELGLLALIERGYHDVHLRIRSDNKGVVGAMKAGMSRSVQSNRVLQRIVTLMLEHNIWLSTEWVASAENPADAPSRGLAPEGYERHRHTFKLPFALREFVLSVD